MLAKQLSRSKRLRMALFLAKKGRRHAPALVQSASLVCALLDHRGQVVGRVQLKPEPIKLLGEVRKVSHECSGGKVCRADKCKRSQSKHEKRQGSDLAGWIRRIVNHSLGLIVLPVHSVTQAQDSLETNVVPRSGSTQRPDCWGQNAHMGLHSILAFVAGLVSTCIMQLFKGPGSFYSSSFFP